MTLSIIVCYNKKRGIGADGGIPWFSSSDLKHFKKVTMGESNKESVVVMGRKTWDSISNKFPEGLPGRKNVVLTRNKECVMPSSVTVMHDKNLLDSYINDHKDTNIFIIGGQQLYKYYINDCDRLYITEIDNKAECDTYFPLVLQIYKLKEYKVENECTYYVYEKTNFRNPEQQYLEIMQRILDSGQLTVDRTNIGTRSTFGERMRFDISESVPLLTTKRVAWKLVLKELLWMLKGQTDNKILQEQNVHIWDGNSSREFLDSLGLTHYEEGDIGSNYGFQWRHWGAEYKGCKEDYTSKGIDQIKKLIEGIKKEPHGRRHLLSAWNVGELKNMTLNPCHCFAQFYVNKELGTLSCQLYQRSGDMFLGVPFNIMSYTVLTYVIAKLTGYKPGEFVHIIGDAHIYLNHEEQVKEQLKRTPLAFPKLEVSEVTDIDKLTLDDFKLIGYSSHGTIKAKMAV